MAYYRTHADVTTEVGVLFLGRTPSAVSSIASDLVAAPRLAHLDLKVYTGTSVEEARDILSQGQAIDHMFIGGGLSLDARLEVVRLAIEASGRTCVHLKDSASGPAGGLRFLTGVLEGLYPDTNENGRAEGEV